MATVARRDAVVSALLVAAGLEGCAVAGAPHQATGPRAAVSAPVVGVPTSDAPASPPPAPPGPDRQPFLVALADALGAWSPRLQPRLAAISLAETDGAEPEALAAALHDAILRDLVRPVVCDSTDPELRELCDALVGMTTRHRPVEFDNLMIDGEHGPVACEPCVFGNSPCTRRCEEEQRRFLPAELAAGVIGADLSFATPRWYPCDSPDAKGCGGEGTPLPVVLDALVAGGWSRPRLEDGLVTIVERLAERARGIDAPLPVAERDAPRPEVVVALALAVWRRTFAPSLAGQPAATLPSNGKFSWDAWEIGWRAFELSMLEAVPSAARYAATLADYHRRRDAYERRCEQGTARDERWEEYPPELDCEALRPASARTCGEVNAGLALLDAALRDLGDRKPPTAEQYQKLAQGLEHLFLAGVPAAAIDAGYRDLVTRLPPLPRPRP